MVRLMLFGNETERADESNGDLLPAVEHAPTTFLHRVRERPGHARMLKILPATFVTPEKGCCMTPETQQFESPYCVRIETETGKSSTVPIAVLTPKQLEV